MGLVVLIQMSADIKWCKDFLQQVTRLPLEYTEVHIERQPTKPAIKPTKSKPSAPSTTTLKVTLKRLGGVSKAHELSFSNADTTVAALRKEAAKIFGVSLDAFSLMYKGRPLTEDTAKVASIIAADPSTAIYVNIKKAAGAEPVAATNEVMIPEAFWSELKTLLGKHVPAPTAEQLTTRFKQEHSKWL